MEYLMALHQEYMHIMGRRKQKASELDRLELEQMQSYMPHGLTVDPDWLEGLYYDARERAQRLNAKCRAASLRERRMIEEKSIHPSLPREIGSDIVASRARCLYEDSQRRQIEKTERNLAENMRWKKMSEPVPRQDSPRTPNHLRLYEDAMLRQDDIEEKRFAVRRARRSASRSRNARSRNVSPCSTASTRSPSRTPPSERRTPHNGIKENVKYDSPQRAQRTGPAHQFHCAPPGPVMQECCLDGTDPTRFPTTHSDDSPPSRFEMLYNESSCRRARLEARQRNVKKQARNMSTPRLYRRTGGEVPAMLNSNVPLRNHLLHEESYHRQGRHEARRCERDGKFREMAKTKRKFPRSRTDSNWAYDVGRTARDGIRHARTDSTDSTGAYYVGRTPDWLEYE